MNCSYLSHFRLPNESPEFCIVLSVCLDVCTNMVYLFTPVTYNTSTDVSNQDTFILLAIIHNTHTWTLWRQDGQAVTYNTYRCDEVVRQAVAYTIH